MNGPQTVYDGDQVGLVRPLASCIACAVNIPPSNQEIAMTHPAVRAKFFVVEVTHRVNVTSIKLGAVCRGEDNKEWASATPSGTITMDVLSAAGGVFKPGDEFFIDFVPAPKGKPGRTDAADDA